MNGRSRGRRRWIERSALDANKGGFIAITNIARRSARSTHERAGSYYDRRFFLARSSTWFAWRALPNDRSKSA